MNAKRFLPILLFSVLATITPVRAEDDLVLGAMTDELNRTTTELHLEGHAKPYFASFWIKEIDESTTSSCLGSKATMDHSRERVLTPIVRIGDYKLDSAYQSLNRPDFTARVPVDNDYGALRRAIWLNTDYVYKNAITNFEWKQAFLAAHNIPDRLPDFSKEAPTVALSEVKPLKVDDQKWNATVEKLSSLFKNHSTLQKSKVMFIARNLNNWHVNSEGTRLRYCETKCAIIISGMTQAPDGEPISDWEIIEAPDETQMPEYDHLAAAVERLAKRLTDLRSAPKGEEYCGPVLFEDQAAAEFFSQIMAPNLGFAEELIGSEDLRNPLKTAVGRRVMSKTLTVLDDPTLATFAKTPLVGGYKFDDDGVPAQKITLVDNGTLKGFCQSRIPTRTSQKSNGHSMGGHGVYSVIVLSGSKLSSADDIKRQMTELAKDAGLDYVIVVRRISDEIHMNEYPAARTGEIDRQYATPSYSRAPSDPIEIYKLYLNDGHRELIRGLEFTYVSLRAFRDIQAVGDDAAPYMIEPQDGKTRHLVTPSYLVGELEMTPVKPEHAAPPILPSPLAVEDETAKKK